MQLILGIAIGVVVCTVGVRGCADLADSALQKTQTLIKENVK